MPRAAHPSPAPRAPSDAELKAQKRAFLRRASHELRTPLNSILGFSEILASELYGPLGAPQYKEYAEIIRNSGHKLLNLVNQMLEIARLEAGVVEWELRPQPLGPVIESVLAEFEAELAARQVRAQVAGEAALPEVVADGRGLHTVLAGLVHNAIVYSPVGDEVRIAARRRGGAVEIAIENACDGVDPQELPRLLKPFEHGGAAHHAAGAGLGLPICLLTCRAMGGRLRLSATPDKRLRALVRLPAP